ncbi:MAG: PQQ-binding-like beta-propeller repeat protein [Pirellula sp.]
MLFRKSLVGIFIGLSCCQLGMAQHNHVQDGFEVAETDWPWWRGPHRNGESSGKQSPPREWSGDKNIMWKAPIVGRGYGSPIVFKNMVVLQTANEDVGSQMVIALDRDSGSVLWETVVHKSGGMRKNPKSTAASNTAAWDGERILVNFANSDAVYLTCLDIEGKQLWQREICKYVEHQGYGSSPLLYQSLVIVNGDNKNGGAIVALDRKSGEEVWQRQRPTKPNYPSPVVLKIAGRDQLVMTGCDLVTSLDPLTGNTLWEVEGATTECVTSTVTDGERVFTSGGYPKNHISAVRADGSNKIDWESNDRVYVPSLLCRDGYLFGILDAGVAACWKSDTGKEVWRSRLGGTFSSSPVLVGDTIYATNEAGETFLFKANAEAFELIGSNKLGDEVLATPVIVGSKIYYRASVVVNDKRQEFLYCIGGSAK